MKRTSLCAIGLSGGASAKRRCRQTADRSLSELVRRLDAKHDQRAGADSGTAVPAPTEKTLGQAVERFLAGKGTIQPDGSYRGDVERNTFRKYATSLSLLC